MQQQAPNVIVKRGRRRLKQPMPTLAKALASRRTSYPDRKDVTVSFRNPEFFSDSASSILDTWHSAIKGKDDDLYEPKFVGTVIAANSFLINPSLLEKYYCFGFKVKATGNQNINTGSEIDATLKTKSQKNLDLSTFVQLNLKSTTGLWYQFFTKNISQVVEPASVLNGNWVTDTVAPPVFFQQTIEFFGTGPNGVEVQIQPLTARQPDVMNLFKQMKRVKSFLAMIESKYKYMCDESDVDFDEFEYEDDDILMYDLES